MYPEATVVGSKVCLQFLSNLMHQTFNQQAVKGGDKVGAQGGGGGGGGTEGSECQSPSTARAEIPCCCCCCCRCPLCTD